jgi:RimJ/RimL family protein N-acetyltransferase
MGFYNGPGYVLDHVRIGPPNPTMLNEGQEAEAEHWYLHEAPHREDVCYFSIYADWRLVGAIFLHDIDLATGETLIGYHLFDPAHRGQGIGTRALTLLKQYLKQQTQLTRAVIITSRENAASQRIALKCGFTHAGAPREDPENGLVFEWKIDRSED